MAAAVRDQVGVALAKPDALVGDAQAMGQDLRERRFVALADMLRAGDQRYRPVVLEADIDILLRRAARALDVIGKTQATQPAGRLALLAARREAREIGARQGRAQSFGE